jgi:hypothetical protein
MNKAQAKFIEQDVLSRIGGNYNSVNENDYPVIERLLMAAGEQFNEQIGINLAKTQSVVSGKLAEPAFPIVKMFGNKYVLEIGYEKGSVQSKYYDFVDKGVKGTNNTKAESKSPYSFKTGKKSIPVSVVKKFLALSNKKAITVKKYTKLGAEKSQVDITKALPFMIARSIHRKGTPSTHYYSDAIKLVFGQDFKREVEQALGAEINIKVVKYWNNKFK